MDLQHPNNGDDDIDSACSTPFTSAPSSPGRGSGRAGAGYFFSAPASPMHFILSSSAASTAAPRSHSPDLSVPSSFEFGFSAPFPAATTTVSMISADELFLNGQIRPMKLPTLLDVDEEENDDDGTEQMEMVRGRDLRMRSRSMRRRTRSMSPMRHTRWQVDDDDDEEIHISTPRKDLDLQLEVDANKIDLPSSPEETPPESTTTSRSSSSGRNSKRWIFLKDLLYRSKSEGRASTKEKFWQSLTFSPSTSSKEKSKTTVPEATTKQTGRGKMSSSKRRGPAPSAHEKHYTANRAVSEEMRKRTFLPYRPGLFGCLGFGAKSYSAVNGFARAFTPVSTR